MSDEFSTLNPGLSSPAEKAFAITPNDSTDLAASTRAIYVGTGGDVKAILVDDSAGVVFANVAAGSILPIRAKRVLATGTDATDLVGLA